MKPFKFKQFSVQQDRCAMKIGTDGVLLGAWTSIAPQTASILDIGAGTGIIALMLAQRSPAEVIDALEIDNDAFEQCVGNFEASPWADRLFCYHASFEEFTQEIEEPYDLIVANPPFYQENVDSGNTARNTARQSSSLPLDVLFMGVAQLLAPAGSFAMVFPSNQEAQVLALAKAVGLLPNRILAVRGNPEAPVKRLLVQFSSAAVTPSKETLMIELERHQYTTAYKELTKDFYLKM